MPDRIVCMAVWMARNRHTTHIHAGARSNQAENKNIRDTHTHTIPFSSVSMTGILVGQRGSPIFRNRLAAPFWHAEHLVQEKQKGSRDKTTGSNSKATTDTC